MSNLKKIIINNNFIWNLHKFATSLEEIDVGLLDENHHKINHIVDRILLLNEVVAMSVESQLLATHYLVSLTNIWVEVQDFMKITNHLKKYMKYASN